MSQAWAGGKTVSGWRIGLQVRPTSGHRPGVGFHDKIIDLAELPAWREGQRRLGRRVVVTNGCFDILHLGHATYLETARALGDQLLVGINGDVSVRELKGPTRPVNGEEDRAALVAALGCVDAVCVFPEVRAGRFLDLVRPDVWAKGADYSLETLDAEERRIVERAGGRIEFIALVQGRSTTDALKRIATT